MELKHATDLEIAKHLASHAATSTGKSREQNRVGKLLADRNARMKKAHVVQPMGLVYKEDRDENMKQEIADRLANTPAERAERKHRVQVAINKAKQLREGNKMKTFSKLQEAITPASPALVSAMNSLLADNFAFYLKAHNYHWNIEGADFAQYHEFLGNLYEDAHGAVDNIAERIRTLKAYALGTMENFMSETSITEDSSVPGPMQMLQNITMDNETLIESLTRAYKTAEADGRVGLANFLQDRIDAHEKHGWMLRSLVKGNLSESARMPVAPVPGDKWKSHAIMVHPETKQRVVVPRKNAKNYPESEGWKEVGPGMRKEEVEQIQEVGSQKKATRLRNKLRDAVAGARYKQTGLPAPEREPKHGTIQGHNKAIGRALRGMGEEVEQIQEVGPQKKLKRVFNKLRDARAGARYKNSGMPVPEREPGHKNTVDHNKAIGRALRKMGEETEQVDEVLKPSMGAGAYVSDFVHSKNPKFAGKSKAERTKMALGAYYGAKKSMEEGLDPVGQEDADVNNDGKHGHSTDKYLLKRRAAISKAMAKKGK